MAANSVGLFQQQRPKYDLGQLEHPLLSEGSWNVHLVKAFGAAGETNAEARDKYCPTFQLQL